MISDKEIEKIAAMKKPVIDEILVKFNFFFLMKLFHKNDQNKLKPASKLRMKDPLWDKEF